MTTRTLDGAHVLVTGADRGVGAAFVETVLAAGAARVLACSQDPSDLEGARRRLGLRLLPVELDVTDPTQCAQVCGEAGRVDLFVSCAGRERPGRPVGHDEADARHLFELHLWGPWRMAHGLLPAIEASGGGMIFVQSIAALVLSRRGPFYSASKSAATMMATALREVGRDQGLVVTNVFPGLTDMDVMADEDVPNALARQTAEQALAAWLAGAASVYPDRFARLVHERMLGDLDAVMDTPGRVVAEEYLRYVAGEDAT
jgi:NAD(P)-dependent dehydrogenase (short-subunit alcohol dehydrogenase family)